MKNIEVFYDKTISINSNKVYLDNLAQIVFVGRSNTGKSSLLNSIFQKKNLVKTSSLPGKTRTANLFKVNNKYHFVDLPGYGFAKLGELEKEKIDSLISWYLEEFKYDIKKVVMILDSKIGPTNSDIDMFKYIHELGLGLFIILNKSDKLSKNEIQKSYNHTEDIFLGQKIFISSAKNNYGIDVLRRELLDLFKKNNGKKK